MSEETSKNIIRQEEGLFYIKLFLKIVFFFFLV